MTKHRHGQKPKNPCECADKGCPAHRGKSSCDRAARFRMRRVDMEDRTGVLFCEPCADDAADSGVFGPQQPLHWRV